MGSWIRCLCGGLIHTNMFCGTHISQLIEDSAYDAIEDPVDRDKLADLFFNKGATVYRCLNCGRLLVEWDNKSAPTFYLPEGKMEISNPGTSFNDLSCQTRKNDDLEVRKLEAREHEYSESNQPDDPQLKELEAIAEAEYDEMYDSRNPTGCYSRAKEAFYGAIKLASQLGHQADVIRLEKRLQHVKAVFRSQFT